LLCAAISVPSKKVLPCFFFDFGPQQNADFLRFKTQALKIEFFKNFKMAVKIDFLILAA
jgi:hypothetical protein